MEAGISARNNFLLNLQQEAGDYRVLPHSRSLLELRENQARIYVRYSRLHRGRRGFYGLRVSDLRQLEGHNSFLAFVWDEGRSPLIVPFDDVEDLLSAAQPASDGQIKVQIDLRDSEVDLCLARVGRFNVESYLGWSTLSSGARGKGSPVPTLSHPQVQSLLGAIGRAKHFDVWIPVRDRSYIDWSVCEPFDFAAWTPSSYQDAGWILNEIDVIWLDEGSHRIRSLYEVEHSTTIYSGLLRLNDARLAVPDVETFTIVADERRKSRFGRHLMRPTFQSSGLDENCSFLDYDEVYRWHLRVKSTT